jgi:hypothetical protein
MTCPWTLSSLTSFKSLSKSSDCEMLMEEESGLAHETWKTLEIKWAFQKTLQIIRFVEIQNWIDSDLPDLGDIWIDCDTLGQISGGRYDLHCWTWFSDQTRSQNETQVFWQPHSDSDVALSQSIQGNHKPASLHFARV